MVFWYCHKRGREVRLEQESEMLDEEVARLDREHTENQTLEQDSVEKM